MAWAIGSLPVPDSPRSRTVVLWAPPERSVHACIALVPTIFRTVAFLRLEPQVGVLIDQQLLVGLNQLVNLHRLRDHRPDDAEDFVVRS